MTKSQEPVARTDGPITPGPRRLDIVFQLKERCVCSICICCMNHARVRAVEGGMHMHKHLNPFGRYHFDLARLRQTIDSTR